MIRISASALHRVVRCPPSASLPQVRQTHAGMAFGTAVHEFLEMAERDGIDAARKATKYRTLVPVLLRIHESVGNRRGMYAPEVSMMWRRADGQVTELGRSMARNYGDTTGCIPGTADLSGISGNGLRGYIGDYKTGFSAASLPRPKEYAPMMFYALCLARLHKLDSVDLEIVRITDTQDVIHIKDTVDIFDLDMFEEKLKAAYDAALAQSGEALKTYGVSEDCNMCPCQPMCPAMTGFVQMMVADPDKRVTAANATEAAHKILLLQGLVDKARAQLNAMSDESPIPMGDGKEFGPIGERHLLGLRARAAIAAKYGEEVAALATETKIKVSQTSIKRALVAKELLPAKGSAAEMSSLMDEMESGGAIKWIEKHTAHKIGTSAKWMAKRPPSLDRRGDDDDDAL